MSNDSDHETTSASQNTSNPFAYLSNHIENNPPFNVEDETRLCKEMENQKFPVFAYLWLAGYARMPKDYHVILDHYDVKSYLRIDMLSFDEQNDDSYPDPLDFERITETFRQLEKQNRNPKFGLQQFKSLEATREALCGEIFTLITPQAHASMFPLLYPPYKQYMRSRENFVNHNYRLVLKTVGKSAKRNLPPEDIFQDGITGLLKGVDRFCFLKGYRFSTYATWWIRQSINRAIAEKGRHIRIPIHMQELLTKIHKEREAHFRLTQKEASVEYLAKLLHEPVKKIKEAIACETEVGSLNDVIGGDDSDTEMVDLIEDHATAAPNEEANYNLLRENMHRLLATLTEREQTVLVHRFGLKDGKEHTLEQVGALLDITRERVRQIQDKALKRLKHPAKLKALHSDPQIALHSRKG